MAEETKPVEDLIIDESLDANSLTIEKTKDDSEDEDTIDDDYEKILEVKEEFVKNKKKTALDKILIGLIVFLVLLLITGAILYFLGFFTPKEEPEESTAVQENTQVIEKKEETYKFDIKDINSKKLNEQLSYLTNKNLSQDKVEELEKVENEKRLIEEQKINENEALKSEEDALLKERNAIENKKIELENEKAQLESMRQEALLLKQELEANKTDLEVTEQNKIASVNNEKDSADTKIQEEKAIEVKVKEEQKDTKEPKNTSSFLKFINVAKIKGSLYKKYLDKITSINTNAILCRDDKNRIEIYFGPFNNDETRTELLNKLISGGFDEAFELELTQEEFNKRCNY